MAGSFAEAAEAAQRVLSGAQRDGDAREDDEDDLSVAAAAVLLQARRYLGDSPAALRTLLETAFTSLRAVPPEALLLWCAAQTLRRMLQPRARACAAAATQCALCSGAMFHARARGLTSRAVPL